MIEYEQINNVKDSLINFYLKKLVDRCFMKKNYYILAPHIKPNSNDKDDSWWDKKAEKFCKEPVKYGLKWKLHPNDYKSLIRKYKLTPPTLEDIKAYVCAFVNMSLVEETVCEIYDIRIRTLVEDQKIVKQLYKNQISYMFYDRWLNETDFENLKHNIEFINVTTYNEKLEYISEWFINSSNAWQKDIFPLFYRVANNVIFPCANFMKLQKFLKLVKKIEFLNEKLNILVIGNLSTYSIDPWFSKFYEIHKSKSILPMNIGMEIKNTCHMSDFNNFLHIFQKEKKCILCPTKKIANTCLQILKNNFHSLILNEIVLVEDMIKRHVVFNTIFFVFEGNMTLKNLYLIGECSIEQYFIFSLEKLSF